MNGMRLAPLTTVADESRTVLSCGLTPRHATPRARTIGLSVIATLPFTGIAHLGFSAHAGAGNGLGMLSRNKNNKPLFHNQK